uniref:Mog1p/PsbP-like protein n=1 Tax=Entomoneis paludosa TaxID=265537 RepID=A0A7S2YGC5_9STRA
MSNSTVRPLYGGAITCQIPQGWLDASDVRQVPDHQECWQDPQTGALLVIEILDYQTSVSNETAAQFFYTDLAESNGISSAQDLQFTPILPPTATSSTLPGFPPDSILCVGTGHQKIVQGKEFDSFGNRRELPDAQWVAIHLALVRLPNVTTDLLVTLSTPAESNPQQGDASQAVFQAIFSTLQIRDWGLFG